MTQLAVDIVQSAVLAILVLVVALQDRSLRRLARSHRPRAPYGPHAGQDRPRSASGTTAAASAPEVARECYGPPGASWESIRIGSYTTPTAEWPIIDFEPTRPMVQIS